MDELKKEYNNGEITVIWQPDLCKHSGNCVQMLPEVYKPAERPWVDAKKATVEQLKSQIECCPSGALSYRMNKADNG